MTSQALQTMTVLPVRSIEEATRWYEESLGFRTIYLHEGDEPGEATNYAMLQRDQVTFSLILDECPEYESPWTKAGTGYLYLIVSDIEQEYAEVQSRGVEITRELQMENWGVQGFNLQDTSGNEIHVEQGT
jgi:uncharacterized glyoxalase superfamily protein PhnB